MGNPETQFEQAADRWVRFEDPCGVMNASLGDLSSRVASSTTTKVELKLSQLARLKKCAEELAILEQEAKARGNACKQIANSLRSEVSANVPIENFNALCTEAFEAAEAIDTNASAQQSQFVININNLMDRVSGRAAEDDVEVALGGSSRQTFKCPILQCLIEQPVKNNGCGHVYSLEGVIQYLYQTMRVRIKRLPSTLEEVPSHFEAPCPAAQCRGKLNKNSLSRDFQAELTQRQQSALANRRSYSGADEAVDIS